METVATAPAETTAPATEKTRTSFKEVFGVGRSMLKGVSGVFALGVGGAMLVSGVPMIMVLGATTLYTGARQLFETGRELLPLGAQSFISEVVRGEKMTQKNPVTGPKTALGHGIRVVEYVALGLSGAVAFAAGGWAIGAGDASGAAAGLFFGGFGTMVSGVVNLVERAVSGVVGLARIMGKKDAQKDVEELSHKPAPDLSPAPALTAKAAEAGFNAAATPEVVAEALKPQPAPQPTAPKAP